jgi:hypothetical protein
VVHLCPMASRCAFKDGSRRCSRNGFGNPPLCRTHAIQVNLDGRKIEFPEESPLFGLLDMADRMFSTSQNDTVQQVRNIFGEFLAGAANQSNAQQVPPPGQPREPRQEPRTPPPPPRTAADPRLVLGFEPGEQLTVARVRARKRELAQLFHPDKQGGSSHAMKRVNEAADELLKSL